MDVISVLNEIPIDRVDVRSILKYLYVYITNRLLTYYQVVVEQSIIVLVLIYE